MKLQTHFLNQNKQNLTVKKRMNNNIKVIKIVKNILGCLQSENRKISI
jgi:hypothetical protein